MISVWIGVDPKSNNEIPYKKQKRRQRQGRRPCEDGGRDLSYAVTRQGNLRATRSWKRQGDAPLELLEKSWLC